MLALAFLFPNPKEVKVENVLKKLNDAKNQISYTKPEGI